MAAGLWGQRPRCEVTVSDLFEGLFPDQNDGSDDKFLSGMRVIVRDKEWLLRRYISMKSDWSFATGVRREAIRNNLTREEAKALGNMTSLECEGLSSLVKGFRVRFVEEMESVSVVDPAQVTFLPDESPSFQRSLLFMESHWRRKVPTDSALHVGYKGAMDLMHYQLEPAAMALSQQRRRILIADTVGLGKTLEAGILLAELIRRGRGKRVLVVTVKSMMMQFQKEFWHRFSIPLVRLDSRKIAEITRIYTSKSNPFTRFNKMIVSVDTLKRQTEYAKYLEATTWDVVIIDEAHNIANRGTKTQRSTLGEKLAKTSDTMIMLSATPHDGRPESFASLMNMLDPTSVENVHQYERKDVRDLCIRRFKKDVRQEARAAFAERSVSVEWCQASAAEEAAYGVLEKLELDMDQDRTSEAVAGMLFKTNLQKSLFSGPEACASTIEERLKKLRRKHSEDYPDIGRLVELLAAVKGIKKRSNSRYNALVELLRSDAYNWRQDADDRVVIFTERLETKKFLAENLLKDLKLSPDAIEQLDGSMSDEQQQKIVDEFGRVASPMRILVATDVASEGINLHYLSHRVIHFDIPWSLMVFQQRNGRVDRYGQSKCPDIRYMMTLPKNPTIRGDVRIMEVLVNKEKEAHKNLGDPALLMGKFNVSEEEEWTAQVIQDHLSVEQVNEAMAETLHNYDPFEELFADDSLADDGDDGSEEAEPADPLAVNSHVECVDEHTFYSDVEYVRTGITYLSDMRRDARLSGRLVPFYKHVISSADVDTRSPEESRFLVRDLDGVEGIEVRAASELINGMNAVLPAEIALRGENSQDNYLRLCPDKNFCMEKATESMRGSLSESSWSRYQYLWPVHPIFAWMEDRFDAMYDRGEAPIMHMPDRLQPGEVIIVLSGNVYNNQGYPSFDSFFAVRFRDGEFYDIEEMEDMLSYTALRDNPVNCGPASEAQISAAQSLLRVATEKGMEYVSTFWDAYLRVYGESMAKRAAYMQEVLDTKVSQEMDRINRMKRDTENYRRAFDKNNRLKQHCELVRNSVTSNNKPYVRVILAIVGAEK